MIDKIAWLYLKDNRILSTRSRGKTVYYIPGGKREPGESDVDTLCREVFEELSVSILSDTAQLYGSFQAQADGYADGIQVRMTLYQADFIGELEPSSEIDEYAWLSYADIDRVSPVDKQIFNDLHAKGLLPS